MSDLAHSKLGVPVFSYSNFESFFRRLEGQGYFTTNLGDNMQSIAVRRLLRALGYSDADMVSVDRDTLPSYDGPPVSLIMNGVFPEWSFPIPDSVYPVFVGITVNRTVVARYREYYKHFEPIDCREPASKVGASYNRD